MSDDIFTIIISTFWCYICIILKPLRSHKGVPFLKGKRLSKKAAPIYESQMFIFTSACRNYEYQIQYIIVFGKFQTT